MPVLILVCLTIRSAHIVSCLHNIRMSDPGTEDTLTYKTCSKLWLGKGTGGDDFVDFRVDWMVG